MVFQCRRNGNFKVCLGIADGSILSGRFLSLINLLNNRL